MAVRWVVRVLLCCLAAGCATETFTEGCGRGPTSKPLPKNTDVPVPVTVRDGRLEGVGDLNDNWYASPVERAARPAPGAVSVPVFRHVPDGRYTAVVRAQVDDLMIISVNGVAAQLEGPLHCE
jgi:hypothetical protein